MLLGQVDALRARIDQYRPSSGHMLRELREYYRIGLTYSSNALEGNSLTESETKVLLEDGLTVGGKPIRDYYEASGHSRAYDFMHSIVATRSITEGDVRQLHRLFYGLIDPPEAGEYRAVRVLLTGSQHALPGPEAVPALMAGFASWLEGDEHLMHPVTFAAKAHLRLVLIHPFIDGNGRVARLLMNLCLLRKGYTVAVIPPVLRGEYISLLERAHKDEEPFMAFIAERVVETQKDLLRLLGDGGESA